VVPKPREDCTKTEQLTVSFAAGYIAGVFCAVVSHPADNLVSKLNAQKGATAGDIIKQMGWYALMTRGLGLRIIMIGTLTGLQVRRLGVWLRIFYSPNVCSKHVQQYACDRLLYFGVAWSVVSVTSSSFSSAAICCGLGLRIIMIGTLTGLQVWRLGVGMNGHI
jgi:hypothetical protein